MSTPTLSPQSPKPHRSKLRIILPVVAGVLVLGFIGIQLIPVSRTNPAATIQIKWDSSQTEALARSAWMDCYSNETTWPWYSYVAPTSWLIYYDVQRGRSELNFSSYASSSGQGQFDSFGQSSGDLAYQLGQILAGGEQHGGPGGGFPGGQLPGSDQFPTPSAQQASGGGQVPVGFGGSLANRLNETITIGQMPPTKYTLMHASARLTDAQRQQLLQGLMATLGWD